MPDRIQMTRDGAVVTLTINRPERLNALDEALLRELQAALETLGVDRQLRCLIVTGAGRAFVAGADIHAMRAFTVAEARAFSLLGQQTFAALEGMRVPVIAAVNGFALGAGCELALACDFAYASATAMLGQPEVKLGVTPGFGGTQRLAQRIGLGRARELIYTGRMVGATEALTIGLVSAVCEPDTLLPRARATAAEIAQAGPRAVEAAKAVMLRGAGRLSPQSMTREAEAFARCFSGNEAREGLAAFLERRRPAFVAD